MASAALMGGGMIGFSWDMMLATLTFGLWCTSWTWGPLVNLCGVVSGLLLLMGPSTALRVLAILGGALMVTDIVNLNLVSFLGASIGLSQLMARDSVAYGSGTWTPPQPAALDDGQTGIVLRTSFVPLAFLLFGCAPKVRIDGAVHRVPWGKSAFPLPPGAHTVSCEVPYLIGSIHAAKREIDVPDGEVVRVEYHAPGWLVFLPGSLRVLAR